MYVHIVQDQTVVEIVIHEYPLKPLAVSNKYYIRKHNSNHAMTTEMITEMNLKTKHRSFDMFLMDNKSVLDLDEETILHTIDLLNSRNEIQFPRDMFNFLNTFELIQGEKITYAAYLLFPKKEIQDTEILIGLFEDDITIKKSKTIRGSLIYAVDEVMDFVTAYITKEYIITGKPARDERRQYPLEAIREFVINAIVHRKYI